MLQIQEKNLVCETHKALLYLLIRYGNGAMPLPLLRTLAVSLGLYTNGQAVNLTGGGSYTVLSPAYLYDTPIAPALWAAVEFWFRNRDVA